MVFNLKNLWGCAKKNLLIDKDKDKDIDKDKDKE